MKITKKLNEETSESIEFWIYIDNKKLFTDLLDWPVFSENAQFFAMTYRETSLSK